MPLQFQYPQNQWVFLILLIPIIVHLLRLRKRQVVWFPGIFRLQSLVKETQSKQRLKHWLLLLNRLLLFLAISLLLTQPRCSDALDPSKEQTLGIILDASNSMWEADADGKVPMEIAKTNLVEWLQRQSPTATVYFFDRPYQEQYRFTVSELKSYLLALSKPIGAYPLQEIFKTNSLPKEVSSWFVFSDLDKDIAPTSNPANDTSVLIQWVDLSVKRGVNYAIDTAYHLNTNSPSIFWQVSRNETGMAQEIWMDIYSNGKLLTKEKVRFEADERVVSDSLPWLEGFSKSLKFVIPTDALSTDNVLYTHANQASKLRVFLSGVSRPSPLLRLIQTFSDRFQLVDSLTSADISIWVSSEEKNTQWQQALDVVSAGKVAVVIPKSNSKRIPFQLISGGNWERLSPQNPTHTLDERRFRQWPFEQILQKEQSIQPSTITPGFSNYFRLEHEQNADWQRMLMTKGDHDFLLHKNLGSGHVWLFTTDMEQGFEAISRSTWFVGIMLPVLLSGNVSDVPIMATYMQDWVQVPFEDKFQRGDLVDIRFRTQIRTSAVGLDNGKLALPKIEDLGLEAGYYQVINKRTKDSIALALNTPRIEQFGMPSEDSKPTRENLSVISLIDWQNNSIAIALSQNNWNWLKWFVLLFMITEVLIQNRLLKTNR